MLLEHLPDDCALAKELREERAWGLTEHLLAALVDLLAVANWQRRMAHSDPPRAFTGPVPDPPEPIPRPGVTPRRKPEETHHGGAGMSAEELRQRLGLGG